MTKEGAIIVTILSELLLLGSLSYVVTDTVKKSIRKPKRYVVIAAIMLAMFLIATVFAVYSTFVL